METPVIRLEHSDARGEIFSISLPGNRELMLLHSLKGSLRGGHAHDCDEVITLLTGRVFYRKHDGDATAWSEHMIAGDSHFIPKGTFHLAEFLEDSWVL